MRADNLHLTLAFIGELPLPKAGEAAEALRRVPRATFGGPIDQVGRFESARVLWASGPPELRLEQLADRVRSELRALHIRFDTKRFAAHVTLLRDVPLLRAPGQTDTVEAIEPFDWPIRDALLMVSERDSQGATRYRRFASL